VNLHGPVRVPSAVAAGNAKITLTLDKWSEGAVAATTHEVAVIVPKPGPAPEPVSPRIKATLIHPHHDGYIHNVQYLSGGKRLLAGDYPGGLAQVWDAESDKQLLAIDCGSGYRRTTGYFTVSPDGQTLYAPRGKQKITQLQRDGKRLIRWEFDGDVRAWDLQKGTLRDVYKHDPPRNMELMRFSPDGSAFITTEEPPGEFERRPKPVSSLWDVRTKRARPLPEGMSAYGNFSPDGKSLVDVTHDELGYVTAVKLFDVATGKEKWSAPIPEAAFAGASLFTRDGKAIIGYIRAFPKRKDYSTWRERLVFWDAETGKELASIPGPGEKVGFGSQLAPDGRMIVCYTYGDKVNNKLYFIDVADRKLMRTLTLTKPASGEGMNTNTIVFSPDGHRIAAATVAFPDVPNKRDLAVDDLPQPRIHLVDVAAGTVVETMVGPRGGGFCAAFSPDGKTLATGGIGRVYLWELSK
jgi:WD40 repeat protein